MARERYLNLKRIDITNMPEVVRIVEEVRKSGKPCLLRAGSEDLAILEPITPHQGVDAIRGAAGSLKTPRPFKKMREVANEDRRKAKFTLESAYGSVKPMHKPEDFEEIARQAKEARLKNDHENKQ